MSLLLCSCFRSVGKLVRYMVEVKRGTDNAEAKISILVYE